MDSRKIWLFVWTLHSLQVIKDKYETCVALSIAGNDYE